MLGAGRPPPATIVFSHANGFPAGTYRVLFKTWLAAGHRVLAPEKLGHDPRYPVTSNWPHLRDELIHFIEREAGEPPFLVGHSLGGLLSVLVTAKRPDLVRGAVLLDSPVPSGWLAGALRFMKATGLGKRFSPSHVAKRRRMRWDTPEAAFDHFALKPAFAAWEPEVLRDYIRSGLEPDAQGHALVFRREVERDIYDTLPHHIPGLVRRQPLQRPVAFIGGRQSLEIRRAGLGATRRVTRGRISWLEGSHLFPFEHPRATAEEVMRWIDLFSTPG